MYFRKRLISLILLCLSFEVFGQRENLEDEIGRFIENNQILIDNEVEIDGKIELLYDRLRRPLDINKAKFRDFEELLILSPIEIDEILEYREKHGSFLSIYELQQIESIPSHKLKSLKPFLTIKSTNKDQRPIRERLRSPDIHYLLLRNNIPEFSQALSLPQEVLNQGKDNSAVLTKYKYQRISDFSFGINLEKDVGEHIHLKNNKAHILTDHKSLFLFLENKGSFEQIIIGDYNLQFGQGLAFGSGFGFGKGGDPIISVKKNNLGIVPHSSSLETGFLRGIALKWKSGMHNIILFSSYQLANANVEMNEIRSFHNSGYHRNENEISKRNTYFEGIGGFKYDLELSRSRIGLVLALSESEFPYRPDKRPDNLFIGNDKSYNLSAFDYEWNISSYSLFGEMVIDNQQNLSLVQGLLTSLSKQTDLSGILRYYSPGYKGIRPLSFGEHNDANNELGLYLGLKQRLGRKAELSFYTDSYYFPWLKFQSSKIQNGSELFIGLRYRLLRTANIIFNYRKKERINDLNETVSYELYRSKARYSMVLEHKLNDKISLRNGFQYLQSSDNAYALYSDLRLEFKKVRIDSRLCYFNTNDFSSAVYLGERDVLYAFSAPALYGQGSRSYFLIKYPYRKNIQLWLKYSFNNRFLTIEEDSSPYDKQGRQASLKVQMKIDLR